jgi:hypothetical protein
VERTWQAAEGMPGRSCLIGLVNLLFGGALILGSIALAQATGVQIFLFLALILLCLLVLGIIFGLAGVVQLTGLRLFPTHAPLRRSALSTLVVYLACLTPYVGWFGLLVYIGLLGLGAFLIGLFAAPRRLPQEAALPAE